MLHSEQYPILTAYALVSAAGALREALLIGYDLPRMEGLWPSEKQCPGFKYTLSVQNMHTCTVVGMHYNLLSVVDDAHSNATWCC